MAILLSACLLTPGKFTSNLDIRRNGEFFFTYEGEITMMGVMQLAQMGRRGGEQSFAATNCFDDENTERTCTAAELADQKKEWEASQARSQERERRETEKLKTMLGGLDPTDPKSIEEFAARLRRQAGWRAVVYKGDGKFDVDYALSGKLDHDFMFPLIEKFPTTYSFIQVLRRGDGTVRVDAPGFAPSAGNNMLGALVFGGMGSFGRSEPSMKLPEMDGTFTVTTDGEILANNTDGGPARAAEGKQLTWAVNVRSAMPPTALIRLSR
ncbi:MAG: hypothetical protein AB7F98_11080 [Novosphingobium sp.]